MSVRTTEANVKNIMETALESKEIIEMIKVANRLVTAKLGSASIDDETMADIETWMTAHLIAIGKERQAIVERVNDIWITYQGNYEFADSLRTTSYGQMCILTDPSGLLQKAGMLKAKINSIPQSPEDY